ncbi:MAG TPA: tetratricopeptide repeat protein [Terriglobales bacterium]|jgi:tetratricopeptide (TPR) repeat protein
MSAIRFEKKVFCAVTTILMLSACSLSPEAKEARFLEKGKKEFQKKNYDVAILWFKNASEAKPWDAEPHYELGISSLAGGDIRSAVDDFRKATELNPRHTGAQLELAELMSRSGDRKSLEEAQKHANAVLASLPEDPDALDVLAATDLRLGKPASAQSYLERSLRKSPNLVKSWVGLAEVKSAGNDLVGAENALRQAATNAPKSPEARIFLGEFYRAHGRLPEAEQQFRQAIAMDPKQGAALIDLGTMQVKAGRTDQADQTFRQAAALSEKQYKPVHAEFLFQIGKRDEALAEFEKLNAAHPDDLNIRTKLVQLYLTLNRRGDAEKILTAAVKKNALDQDALMRRSRLYLDEGKYTEAETDLNQVLHYNKGSADAYYLLSKVSQGRANREKEKQSLEEALKLDPAFLTARIDLAKVLLASRNAAPALTLLDEAPESQMDRLSRILERNWALLALGKKEEARKGIDRILAAGTIPEALIQDAAAKLNLKDYAGARKSAEEALNKTPGDTRALFTLVQIYAAQKQFAAAMQTVRQYALKEPKSAEIQEYLGQVLSNSGDRAGARKAFEAAKAARPAYIEADFALAELDAADGKVDDARKRLAGIVASHPDNKNAHLILAEFEAANGKRPAAVEQFRKVVALDDNDAGAFNSLAYLLAENKQPDEALKYARRAKELAPNNPAVDDTLGWIYYQQGSYPLAVVRLEAATAKGASAVREYHLAMAYLKAGKPERGRQTLDAALKMDPKLPEAQAARQTFGLGPK